MGTEFFDELGETISRTARGLSERAEQIYETQKLRNRISSEERAVDKIMADLGNMVYRRYLDGAPLDDEQIELCRQIDQHKEQIAQHKSTMAGKKGKKICPSCGGAVDLEASFCPNCGTAVPNPEPETVDVPEEDAEVSEETAGEAAEEEAVPEEQEPSGEAQEPNE